MRAQRRFSTRGGFTLVEVMFVVALIGLLLAIALPDFIGARENSRAKSCQGNLRHIQWAKEEWAMANHAGLGDEPTWDDLVGPTLYLKTKPVCPNSGTYTIGPMRDYPECSIGTNGTPYGRDDHVYP